MMAVVEKAKALVGRKSEEVDPVVVSNLKERDEIKADIEKQSAKIVKLQAKAKAHNEVDPAEFNETQMSVVGMELESAERVFFTLYNRLRVLHALKPLEGVKFTGDYNYQAHVKE